MQLTRQTDYAIRCVLHLAQSPHKVIMVEEIAKARAIPKDFLFKILQKLAKAKIVKSYRGIKGGYQLAQKPEDINLLDIIEVIEGPMAMNVCALDKRRCNFSNNCPVHQVWVELRKEVERRLSNSDFASLAAYRPPGEANGRRRKTPL